jgi:hypothetical protein
VLDETAQIRLGRWAAERYGCPEAATGNKKIPALFSFV